MLVAGYHRLLNLAPNQRLDNVLLPNGMISKWSNLNVHENLWKHEK